MASEYGGSAESFLLRHRNALALAIALVLQFLLLAMQIRRPLDPAHPEAGSVRLIRSWGVGVVAPFEKGFVGAGHLRRDLWESYVDLRHVRGDNDALRAEIDRLRIEQARLREQAGQAQRLQQLLDFKQHFVQSTVAAQVIGSSGSEQSRLLILDKGAKDGIRPDMAVITPDGIVGKIVRAFDSTSQLLMISDPNSGVGAVLNNSRLHGIVRGNASGGITMLYVMKEEDVKKGDTVVTSGGDRIFPRGLPVGEVEELRPGSDVFLTITLKPAAKLDRLDEVLVVTAPASDVAQDAEGTVSRASDVLAQRLPTVQPKPQAADPKKAVVPPSAPPVGPTIHDLVLPRHAAAPRGRD